MPKIDAPTVAEHRAQKERQILEATLSLLAEDGPDAVTHAAIAERTGLARTSVYQYHASPASLLAAGVEELFRRAQQEVSRALHDCDDAPEARLRAYVGAMLRIAKQGHNPHRPIVLRGAPKACHDRIRTLHDSLMAPLSSVVAHFDPDELRVRTALAAGVIEGAVKLVDHGADLDESADQATDFLVNALRSRSVTP